jgi:hypothetical protein
MSHVPERILQRGECEAVEHNVDDNDNDAAKR